MALITVDMAHYDTEVRVYTSEKGMAIKLPLSLCDSGPVGRKDVVLLVSAINRALLTLQEPSA